MLDFGIIGNIYAHFVYFQLTKETKKKRVYFEIVKTILVNRVPIMQGMYSLCSVGLSAF